jgi:hypothetical protein
LLIVILLFDAAKDRDRLVADELHKIEVIKQILDNAHSEDIPAWAAKVRKVMAKVGEISLMDLQRRSRLSLLDLWLGATRIFTGVVGFWFWRSMRSDTLAKANC